MTQYEMSFEEIAHNAMFFIHTERQMTKRFIHGLNFGIRCGMARHAETNTTFHQVVEIDMCLEHICSQERERGNGFLFRWFWWCLIWKSGTSQQRTSFQDWSISSTGSLRLFSQPQFIQYSPKLVIFQCIVIVDFILCSIRIGFFERVFRFPGLVTEPVEEGFL